MISNLRNLRVPTPLHRGSVLLSTRGGMLLNSRACLATALLARVSRGPLGAWWKEGLKHVRRID